MTVFQRTESRQEIFPYNRWDDQLDELAGRYQKGDPFPHIFLDNFHEEDVLREVLKEFPSPRDKAWIKYRHFNENKTGLNKRSQFPEAIGKVIDDFNSPRFVEFLSRLTGIAGLMPDPSLEGGGMHHKKPNWQRRCNLILYLNEGWKEEWGGSLELWDRPMKEMKAKIAPFFNRAVIFSTSEHSYHGHPDAMTCPADRYRRSLALYYYTLNEDSSQKGRSTDYRTRPGESWKAPFVWIDKILVHLYSRFGLSDDFAGKILGMFSRHKGKKWNIEREGRPP